MSEEDAERRAGPAEPETTDAADAEEDGLVEAEQGVQREEPETLPASDVVAASAASAAPASSGSEQLMAPAAASRPSHTESKLSSTTSASLRTTASASLARRASARASAVSAAASMTTSGRGPRSRSAMSVPGTPGTPGTLAGSSRVSVASRSSRATAGTAPIDYGLSPGLQQLIERIASIKDVGLIAYLSAIPGEPHRATRPPAAVARLQRTKSARPKSIMKISKPQVRFEPTYRVEPLRPFRTDRARAVVQAALEMGMAGATYSEQWATDACRILAAYITQCVKGLDTQRYKLGTMVSVLQRHSQGVRAELAVLWDDTRDRYCAASVETTTMTAFAVVYAVYWD